MDSEIYYRRNLGRVVSMGALVIGRRRIKIRFFILLGFIIAGVVYGYQTLKPPPVYAAVTYGDVLLVHNGRALIIREEEVYNAPAYGKVVYHASDGEMVSMEQPIARLYKENFDEEIMYKLYAVQEKILKYQQDNLLDQVHDSDLNKLDRALIKTVTALQENIRLGEHPSLGRKESQLRGMIAQRQLILDKRSEPDDFLKKHYEQEGHLLKQIEDWYVDIVSPKPGFVSFYIDGLENVLDARAVDKLIPEDFRQLLVSPLPDPSTGEAKAEQPFFRVVDSLSDWYIALEHPYRETYYRKGDKVSVHMYSGTDQTYPAIVYKVVKGKAHTLLLLQMQGDPARVVNLRTVPIELSKPVQGLIVPDKALIEKKGRTGIEILSSEQLIFVEIAVIALSDGYAVVEPVSDTQVLRLHDQVRVR